MLNATGLSRDYAMKCNICNILESIHIFRA